MKEQLRILIENGKYEEADVYLKRNITEENYDDEIAVFDGTIGLYYGERQRVWDACANGLALAPDNYELYVVLGEYYLETNINQAYLCYENALFYCNKNDDKEAIESIIEELEQGGNVTVRKTSFVILSYNLLDYTKKCIESIRLTTSERAREIVVVDNASEDGSVEWLREQKDIVLVENKENVGFPKGCNQGSCAANANNDVFLLNNDTMMVDNALFWLRMGLYENENVGTTGSVTNYCVNMQQVAGHIRDVAMLQKYGRTNNVLVEYPYEEKLFLVGFALLIKRKVFDEVGFLDERFTPGNYEDNDYGVRVLNAGYKNVLCKNSFIIHFGSKSFKKEMKKFIDVAAVNANKFKEKWGINPNYYFYPRRELIELIDEQPEKSMNILDIGCGCGAMLGHIKGLYPSVKTYGIEIVENAANFARCIADEVICGDVEQVDFLWEDEIFDYVIMGDVLEHLRRPDVVLKRLRKHVKKGGHIIVSMPNVKHYSVILPLLLKDEFRYSDAGILDTTHLKMYTATEINKLIVESGYVIEVMNYTQGRSPDEEENKILEKLLSTLGVNNKETFLAYQYIVKAECS